MIDTLAQDIILLEHAPQESKTYFCQGCNTVRDVKYRIMKKVFHQGRVYNHPRCTYCMGKSKEAKAVG